MALIKKKIFLVFISVILLLVCLLIVGCNSNKQANNENTLKENTLKVAVEDNCFPMQWKNSNGEYVGLKIDYMNQLGKEIGYEIEYQSMNYEQIVDAVAKHEVDISINTIAVTDSTKAKVDFTDAYAQEGVNLYVDKISNLTLESLKEQAKNSEVQIACQKWIEKERIRQELGDNIKFIEYTGLDDCLYTIKNQQVKAAFGDSSAPQNLIKNKYSVQPITMFNGEEYDICIAVNKDLKNIKDKLNEAIAKLETESYAKNHYLYVMNKVAIDQDYEWDGKFTDLK